MAVDDWSRIPFNTSTDLKCTWNLGTSRLCTERNKCGVAHRIHHLDIEWMEIKTVLRVMASSDTRVLDVSFSAFS